jgi:methylthioribose-1-phosphate isomerase
MQVGGIHYRTIWLKAGDQRTVQIIDQRRLPFAFSVVDLTTVEDAARAIREMYVRGAGLIGATAAYGMYLAVIESGTRPDPEEFLGEAARRLIDTRPTAVNLKWAVERMLREIMPVTNGSRLEVALRSASRIAEEDADCSLRIGRYGLEIIRDLLERKPDRPLNILTHCNAGWLGFIDHGTATAPIYLAHEAGIPVHVWVDETRPRNQGARLTAWELAEQGVPHTVIPDNTGGHLMQHGLVDMVIVGTDRTTRCGDVANKIGTYLKALAAFDNRVPFYVALPSSTIDWNIRDGIREIEIEQRSPDEVRYVEGWYDGEEHRVMIMPENSPVANYGFDVTPARLITGLITERGVCEASESGLAGLFPEYAL